MKRSFLFILVITLILGIHGCVYYESWEAPAGGDPEQPGGPGDQHYGIFELTWTVPQDGSDYHMAEVLTTGENYLTVDLNLRWVTDNSGGSRERAGLCGQKNWDGPEVGWLTDLSMGKSPTNTRTDLGSVMRINMPDSDMDFVWRYEWEGAPYSQWYDVSCGGGGSSGQYYPGAYGYRKSEIIRYKLEDYGGKVKLTIYVKGDLAGDPIPEFWSSEEWGPPPGSIWRIFT